MEINESFEKFWKSNWNDNSMPVVFNLAIKEIAKKAFEFGVDFALCEMSPIEKYDRTGVKQ